MQLVLHNPHNMIRNILYIILTLCPLTVLGQNDLLQKAIMSNDIYYMVTIPKPTDNQERRIIDALCTMSDFKAITYEELLSALQNTSSEKIKRILEREKAIKDEEIRKHVASLSLEGIMDYVRTYPNRKVLVEGMLDKVLAPNIESLSYHELIYLKDIIPSFSVQEVEYNLNNRRNEKIKIVEENASAILGKEKKDKAILKYALEKIIWTYFVKAHEELTRAYSQISMVSDNPNEAASQYQKLVKACYNPKYLQSLLQEEIDKYCTQVNASRAEYAKFTGNNNYPKLSYSVPAPNFQSGASKTCFYKIAGTRQRYVEGRENVNSASGVIGWIFGGIAGVVTKGIGDLMAIDSLVDAEYESRLKYVQDVHDALHKSCVNYSKNVINNLEKTFTNNQNLYEKYLTNK